MPGMGGAMPGMNDPAGNGMPGAMGPGGMPGMGGAMPGMNDPAGWRNAWILEWGGTMPGMGGGPWWNAWNG